MVHAIGNLDPWSGAFVLSRGIVASHDRAPTVASPIYKPVFELRTGACVTDPSVRVPVHEARRAGDEVQVRLRRLEDS
jgi:nitrite reductase (NADH) small subunit